MPAAVTFTLAEVCEVLEPPLTERQLRVIVTALGWQPAGHRRTGKAGHPFPTYDAGQLLRLHGALVPFMAKP